MSWFLMGWTSPFEAVSSMTCWAWKLSFSFWDFGFDFLWVVSRSGLPMWHHLDQNHRTQWKVPWFGILRGIWISEKQPLAATRSHSSGRKWPLFPSGRKWPRVAAFPEWPQVAAFPEWPQVAASGRFSRVAASGRFSRVAASGREWPPLPHNVMNSKLRKTPTRSRRQPTYPSQLEKKHFSNKTYFFKMFESKRNVIKKDDFLKRRRGLKEKSFFRKEMWLKKRVSESFGTYSTHAQTCDVTRVQSATQWIASEHTLDMPKPVM